MKRQFCKFRVIVPTIASLLSLNIGLNFLLVSGFSLMLTSEAAIAAPKSWKLRFKPPNRGAPGTNGSGASRPSCPASQKPFAVMASISSNFGETIDPQPIFRVYQPYRAVAIEFKLLDETETVIFSHAYKPKGDAGIVKLVMPSTAPALVVGKFYRWQVNFVCNPKTKQSYFAEGTIVRRDLDNKLKLQLRRAKSEERAVIFAEQGLWYNALHEMAVLRQLKPKDAEVQANWKELLTHPDVGLDVWVNEPLLD
jgi:hypothetical protein